MCLFEMYIRSGDVKDKVVKRKSDKKVNMSFIVRVIDIDKAVIMVC